MHISAGQGSLVPVFHQILADIGDEQSLEQSLSTFSSHMSRIAVIFKQVDGQSLVGGAIGRDLLLDVGSDLFKRFGGASRYF